MNAEIYDGCHHKIMWIYFISITIWFVSSAGASRTPRYERWLWIQGRKGKALSPCWFQTVLFGISLICNWALSGALSKHRLCRLLRSLSERARKGSARSSHSDLMRWMNMYKTGHVTLLMVIGLMPAWSQKQMAITLPSCRCWDRLLLNMTTTINTVILYCQD